MRRFTKKHFLSNTNTFGKILYYCFIINPYCTSKYYYFTFNFWNPLSYITILLLITASFFFALVSSDSVGELLDSIIECTNVPDDRTDIKWVRDLPEV